jgi:histidine triad (HIT) family protein
VADQCLFCRIVAKEIPAQIVAETDDLVAFRDINPQAPVHILVVPREHVPSLNQVAGGDVVAKLSAFASELARREGIAERGYRTVINTNADAGQTVFHLHLHLLGGRRMGWPPG